MSSVDDLIAFLRARLDEDETVAMAATRAANTDTWIDGAEGSVLGVGGNMHIRGAVLSIDDIGPHIARWDPARVLAEVEAKRRMIDERPTGAQFPGMEGGYELGWEDCLRYLALPYADHPDYREGWRPDV